MIIRLLFGNMKNLWQWLLPLLQSEVGKFLADPLVRRLALDCVENVSGLDLNGDGKFEHATADLANRLRALGRKHFYGWLAVAIQAAYERLKKEKGWVRDDDAKDGENAQ